MVVGYVPPAHPKPKSNPNTNNNPAEWNPTQVNRPPGQPLPSGNGPVAPLVPGGKDASGHTVVDTPSLELFASNIALLIPVVKGVMTDLGDVNVQPGAFYHADQIRLKLGGANGDAGLKAQFIAVLKDLANGLTDVHDAIHSLSKTYARTEDANGMKVTDLQNDFTQAQADFTALITDASGAPSGGK